MAVHAYGLTFPPDDPPRTDEINFRRAELLRQILVDHGDAHKRVFITEGGWNDHPRWTKAVRPYDRIVHTLRAYDMALNDWPWCEAVCLWAFRFPWPNKTYQDHYAFVTPEFIPKPVYIEARNYALDLPYEYLEGDPLSPP